MIGEGRIRVVDRERRLSDSPDCRRSNHRQCAEGWHSDGGAERDGHEENGSGVGGEEDGLDGWDPLECGMPLTNEDVLVRLLLRTGVAGDWIDWRM